MKLNDKVYDILKWLGLAFFPALGILLQTVLPVWGVDPSLIKALTVTCNAIGVFIAALIGVSQVTLYKEKVAELEGMDDIQDGIAEDEDPVTEDPGEEA